jgi:hypothetical protein
MPKKVSLCEVGNGRLPPHLGQDFAERATGFLQNRHGLVFFMVGSPKWGFPGIETVSDTGYHSGYHCTEGSCACASAASYSRGDQGVRNHISACDGFEQEAAEGAEFSLPAFRSAASAPSCSMTPLFHSRLSAFAATPLPASVPIRAHRWQNFACFLRFCAHKTGSSSDKNCCK